MASNYWAADSGWIKPLFAKTLLLYVTWLNTRLATFSSAMKVLARTTSSVVTPKIRLGS